MKLLSTLLFIVLISCDVQKNKTITDTSKGDEVQTIVSQDEETDEKQIRDCFSNYKSAILNDEGPRAAEQVDSRTLQYYTDILDKSLSADSTSVNELNVLDKLMVLSVRHRTPEEDLLSFDGRQLFIYAIQSGMVGKNSVANNEVGEITIDENFAKGQLVVGGRAVPAYFHFYKEASEWKVDLTSIFPMGTAAFQNVVSESGEAENEYLLGLLELITGEKPTAKIWNSIKQ